MSELSLAAQAVWEAFNADEAGVFVDYGQKLAAALEAVADQLVPKEQVPPMLRSPGLERLCQRQHTRSELLAIANELKAD